VGLEQSGEEVLVEEQLLNFVHEFVLEDDGVDEALELFGLVWGETGQQTNM
jgi:hypothetical protein